MAVPMEAISLAVRSGAGPALYGLFNRTAEARAAAKAVSRLGRTWITVPAWYG